MIARITLYWFICSCMDIINMNQSYMLCNIFIFTLYMSLSILLGYAWHNVDCKIFFKTYHICTIILNCDINIDLITKPIILYKNIFSNHALFVVLRDTNEVILTIKHTKWNIFCSWCMLHIVGIKTKRSPTRETTWCPHSSLMMVDDRWCWGIWNFYWTWPLRKRFLPAGIVSISLRNAFQFFPQLSRVSESVFTTKMSHCEKKKFTLISNKCW